MTAPVLTPAPVAPAASAPALTPARKGSRIDRLPRWVRRTALVVLLGGGLILGVQGVGAILIGFAILTPLELAFRRHEQPVRRPGLRADMLHLVVSSLLSALALAVPLVILAVVLEPFVLRSSETFITGLPVLAQGLLAFLVFEIGAYFAHRMSHEVPFLWRIHSIHHSSEALDWISAARIHPLDGVFTIGFVGFPLILLGFEPVSLGALTLLANIWAITLHMNVRWRMRWLDGIWGTPEYHHWHHSAHAEAINHNYSGFLPVLDRVFGTYYQPRDRRPELYGVEERVPQTWLGQLAFPLRRQRRDLVPF